MGVAFSLISVQIYGYIPTKAHKLRKFLSVTPISGKKWVISLFSTFLCFFAYYLHRSFLYHTHPIY